MSPDQATLDRLSELIAFDTTSRNSNLELIEYVAAMLESAGVRYELTHNDDRRKANLFATLGESRQPGVVLSGHTDVVPVDGQDWDTDPFRTEIRDGLMFGRGTSDMKGFLAICLSRMQSVLEADLPVPVHFAFSYDEEVGCVGVRGLLEELRSKPVLPRICIIGEPTSMGVVRAHKGMFFKRCCVTGKSAHSSLVHQGVNAVTAAARIISRTDDVQQRIAIEGPFDHDFDPPYSTLHCGVVHGGTANNIIPAECRFDFEIRNLPGHEPLPLFQEIDRYAQEDLLPAMRERHADSSIQWETLAEFPGLDTALDDPVIDEVAAITSNPAAPGKVSYGAEGGHFQKLGISTVICGPGSIEQAHKPNEFIELEQLALGEQFIDKLVGSLAQPSS